MVRVANTGISGVIDGYGRIIQMLGLGKNGIIDSKLPTALEVSTPYSRLGDVMTLFIILLFFGAGFMSRRIVPNLK